MNKKNIEGYPHSPEEARENGRKGGRASGETKRRRKAMKEIARTILAASCQPGMEASQLVDELDIELPEGYNLQFDVLLAIARKAIEGDVRAATFLRDTAGEDPRDLLAAERLKLDRERLQSENEKRENGGSVASSWVAAVIEAQRLREERENAASD